MKKTVKNEVEKLIKELNLDCTVKEFKDKVDWVNISQYQKLSEDFIREFKDEVDWGWISVFQKLSEDFIREFKDKVDIKVYNTVHEDKTIEQKKQEVIQYAKEHDLKYDNEYIYAFREHDKYNSGIFNKTIQYKRNKYYRDWHCDMRKDIENSFGLGIFPKGNVPVKVKIEDWGVSVNRVDGKARVWGFEII